MSPENSYYAGNQEKRIQEITEALFEQSDIMEKIISKADTSSPGMSVSYRELSHKLRGEFEAVHNVPGFGRFDENVKPEKMELEQLHKRVLEAMPTFFALISPHLIRPGTTPSVSEYAQPFLALFTIISRT